MTRIATAVALCTVMMTLTGTLLAGGPDALTPVFEGLGLALLTLIVIVIGGGALFGACGDTRSARRPPHAGHASNKGDKAR